MEYASQVFRRAVFCDPGIGWHVISEYLAIRKISHDAAEVSISAITQ